MIRPGFLDSESRRDLIELARDGSAAHRLARRANALVLLDKGMSCQSIAEVLLLDGDTIRTWYQLYQEDGIEGLASFGHEGGSCRLTVEQQDQLKAWIATTLPRSTRAVGAWIAAEYGIEYQTRSGLIALLHRIGMEHRKPKAISRKLDPAETVHGHQQLSLFNAHHDERCFMPVHVYDADTGHCVLTILRPGKTPDGKEVRGHLRRLVRRIRRHWPRTRITIRGDSHYGRREAMDWCEKNGVEYVFGLSKNAVLAAQIFTKTDEVCVRRAIGNLDVVRDYTETHYAAKSWSHPRRVVARIEATRKGLDTRYVVTSIIHCPAQWLYESIYCARGQAENLIKRHKSQLASDRTSCRSPLANQM